MNTTGKEGYWLIVQGLRPGLNDGEEPRNGARFALRSVGKRGYQTLLLRLSAVLRDAMAMCRPLITPDNRWHKTTWPEFQPSLPPGREGEDGFDDEIGDAESH